MTNKINWCNVYVFVFTYIKEKLKKSLFIQFFAVYFVNISCKCLPFWYHEIALICERKEKSHNFRQTISFGIFSGVHWIFLFGQNSMALNRIQIIYNFMIICNHFVIVFIKWQPILGNASQRERKKHSVNDVNFSMTW